MLTATSQTFGPVSGMHVQVDGTASIGYRAVIYDGKTFVTGRGMVGPWDVTVIPGARSGHHSTAAHLQNRYTKVTYSPATRTLTLSGATNTVQSTTVSRFESYRFVGDETIASIVGIQANKAITAWYSPYTDFPASWEPMWAGGRTRNYNSPPKNDDEQDSPVPVLGESDGQYVYGMASAATWDYPVPGYNTPHLVIDDGRLAAPQIGTQAHPVLLRPGAPRRWETVFFRSSPSLYDMELGGEVAMAEALGFTTANSPGLTGPGPTGTVPAGPAGPSPAERQQAAADFGLIMRATAYWLREAPGGSGQSVAPSPHYAPTTYMRDSFWTTLGLAGTPLFAATEEPIFTAFTRSVPTTGAQAGHVPVALGGPLFPDESNLLYLVRLYEDALVHDLPVENVKVARLVLKYVQTKQVHKGAWLTAAPKKHGRFTISPDTWLDGYLYPQGAVSGYAQGLYVVALEAARRLGLGVTKSAITRADSVYRSLYDPKLGYLRWLSTTTLKGPDVLAGDALSLLLFNQPLLPEAEAASTLAHQYWTPYGMADLATEDDTYLAADRFETIELSGEGGVMGVGETGGWYQNGGSWFLYAYLAEWAADRQGDTQASGLMARSIDDEVAVTPMSKEFQLTSARRGYYPYPPGSSNVQRQGYGWNAAYLAFARELPAAGRPALRVTGKGVSPLPGSSLEGRPPPEGAYYGPATGMHVVVTGRPSTGLAADIVDGHTLVSRRGLVGPADITVLAPAGPVRLWNRYTKASYDRATATLTLSGATNTVAGTRLTRWESYRLVRREVIEAKIGVSAAGGRGIKLYYSPYTDFPSAWEMLRPVANSPPHYRFTRSYSSPPTGGSSDNEYGLPLLGADAGDYIYGVASGDTWQYPIDGYDDPHLTVQGSRLGAPQIGDTRNPVGLAPGQSRQWMQVFYRSAPSVYYFELEGEVAMANTLGYTHRSSPGVTGQLGPKGLPAAPVRDPRAVEQAMLDWGLVLDATAYWDLQTTPSGIRTVVPSNAYTPRTFMRDSFWTLLGLGGPLGEEAEEYSMRLFSAHIARAGPAEGVVPTSVLPPDRPGYGVAGGHRPPVAADESNLLYIIRMYYDVEVRHLTSVLDRPDATLALNWVIDHRVHQGRIVQITTKAGSWLDTAYTPLGSVNAYSQGIYVVALMAAQGLGLNVGDSQVSAAQSAYAALYRPSLGYLSWDSAPGYHYRAPDVLAGEAWSLFLFNRSILPTPVVAGTLRSLVTTPYGVADLAGADGSHLEKTNPLVLAQGIGNLDSPGQYQNGGDWYLFNYWAAYAGERLHIPGSGALISWDTGRQLAVDPTSHEYLVTKSGPDMAAGRGAVPMSAPSYRQGYGWNAAFNAFDPTVSNALTATGGTMAPTGGTMAPTGGTMAPTAGTMAPTAGRHASLLSGPATQTAVAVDTNRTIGAVSRAALGQDYEWDFDGMGSFDSASGHYYANFVHQLADGVQPGSLRYPGGTTSDTFHWERAIGPEPQRTPNAYGPSEGASPSTVGPDEFGQLLDDTGATGVITVNFGTGTAAEAADFVSYMTGAVGTSKWADLRAKYGHPKPYDVPWWGVGNEALQPSELYWRAGAPVSVGSHRGPCEPVVTCLYIYGGSTRFTSQPVVGYATRTPHASVSTGKPGQSFYAAYPPVLTASATVYVSGTAWKRVPNLDTAGPDAHVYVLDPASGRVTFGDGARGAVPPAGSQVTISYVSGPHDGFLQFYKAMKAANPSIKVCSSDADPSFIEAMGPSLPYDCLQDDSYASASNAGNDVPIGTYERDIMVAPQQQALEAASLERTATRHAGHAVPLVVMEYGQLLPSNPAGYPDYHYSLDEALLNASQLVEWLHLGTPVADRQIAAGEIPRAATPCCTKLPGGDPYATTAAIGTPGPGTVLEATGELYGLLAGLGGGTLLPVTTDNNPVLATVGGQTAGALLVLAVRKGHELYVAGINRSPSRAVNAGLLLKGSTVTTGGVVERLDGASPLSYNTAAAPHSVRVTRGALAEAGSDLTVNFPAHSVTLLQLPVAPAGA
ncbi:MAG TPA: hypothetical protein VMF65_06425 [Acidimicrobiales bacterium]|nr:hypothetical protein [Acidimicrobiales bacterium]